MQIEQVSVRVTTTGAAGSATGSAVSSLINGYLLDVYLDFHASAPATTDTTIAYDEPDLGTILAVSNSVTDALIAPRQKFVDNANAAIANSFGMFPVNGNISVTVAQCDALTDAVVARFRFLRY